MAPKQHDIILNPYFILYFMRVSDACYDVINENTINIRDLKKTLGFEGISRRAAIKRRAALFKDLSRTHFNKMISVSTDGASAVQKKKEEKFSFTCDVDQNKGIEPAADAVQQVQRLSEQLKEFYKEHNLTQEEALALCVAQNFLESKNGNVFYQGGFLLIPQSLAENWVQHFALPIQRTNNVAVERVNGDLQIAAPRFGQDVSVTCAYPIKMVQQEEGIYRVSAESYKLTICASGWNEILQQAQNEIKQAFQAETTRTASICDNRSMASAIARVGYFYIPLLEDETICHGFIMFLSEMRKTYPTLYATARISEMVSQMISLNFADHPKIMQTIAERLLATQPKLALKMMRTPDCEFITNLKLVQAQAELQAEKAILQLQKQCKWFAKYLQEKILDAQNAQQPVLLQMADLQSDVEKLQTILKNSKKSSVARIVQFNKAWAGERQILERLDMLSGESKAHNQAIRNILYGLAFASVFFAIALGIAAHIETGSMQFWKTKEERFKSAVEKGSGKLNPPHSSRTE